MFSAILLAYDFYPSEGGIQTLMRSMVISGTGIRWTVLTRTADDCSALGQPYPIVRTTMRPQLRIIDRLWLKFARERFTLPKFIAFQTKRKLISLGREVKADFLFADQLCSALSVKLAAQTLGIPWAMGIYGKELLNLNEQDKDILTNANLLLACSVFSKELAVNHGGIEKQIRVLHPAVDTDFFKPLSDRQSTKRRFTIEGRETLITVAHLVPRKGHEQVIRSLPGVRRVYPNVIYLVIGRGTHESYLRSLAAELGVSDAVRFCGYVPTCDLPLYYGAADIHIMASTNDGDVEGFGISFIEAAACGTPSIGSRSGGIPDAVAEGESGFLVQPGNVHEIENAILKMLGNKALRDQMGIAARNMAATRFSNIAFEKSLRNSLEQTVLSRQR